MEDEKKPKRSIFFRSYYKDGKGVKKEEKITDFNFVNFFKLYFRKFSQLIYVNLLYIFGNFPVLFFILGISGNFANMSSKPINEIYSVIYGISKVGGANVGTTALMGIFGTVEHAFDYNTVACYILFGISALILFTFGPVNAGCAYIIRNLVTSSPILLFQDFFGTIKQNLRQSIILGFLDALILAGMSYGISFYRTNYNQYWILFFVMIATLIIYMFMRFYMYTILVTFKVTFKQLIKNSFILAILCMGRNFIALLSMVAVIAISYSLFMVFMPIGVIVLALLIFSTLSFISTYVGYPKIKQFMIDPFYNTDEDIDEESEQIFTDNG